MFHHSGCSRSFTKAVPLGIKLYKTDCNQSSFLRNSVHETLDAKDSRGRNLLLTAAICSNVAIFSHLVEKYHFSVQSSPIVY